VWFTVEDDGRGFAPEGAQPSSDGLGLAIMRYRAASFGGRIRTGNRPEGGARVDCHVPTARLIPVPARPDAVLAKPAPPIGLRPGTPRRARIVIADDHPVFRVGLRSLVETDPRLEVVESVDSIAAIDHAIELSNPDVLVTDLLLGESSVLDHLPRWRAKFPGLRLLVVSMYPEHSHAPLVRAAGADVFITKHRAAADIVHRISELVGPGAGVSNDP
jgi:CheY-like chemotaxis protein